MSKNEVFHCVQDIKKRYYVTKSSGRNLCTFESHYTQDLQKTEDFVEELDVDQNNFKCFIKIFE